MQEASDGACGSRTTRSQSHHGDGSKSGERLEFLNVHTFLSSDLTLCSDEDDKEFSQDHCLSQVTNNSDDYDFGKHCMDDDPEFCKTAAMGSPTTFYKNDNVLAVGSSGSVQLVRWRGVAIAVKS